MWNQSYISEMSRSFAWLAKFGIATAAMAGTAGCTTLESAISKFNSYEVEPATTSLNAALTCLSREVKAEARRSGTKLPKVVLIISEIDDETKSSRDPYTGRLSYGGRRVVEDAVRRYFPPEFIFVPLTIPSTLADLERGHSVTKAMVEQLEILQRNARAEHTLYLSMGFTKFDESLTSRGRSIGITYDDKKTETTTSKGESTQQSVMGLRGKLGEPIGNTFLHPIAFDVQLASRSNNLILNFGYDRVGLGYERQKLVVDGVHGAQETLLIAAVYDIAAYLAGAAINERCLKVKSEDRGTFAHWMELTESGQVEALQTLLARQGYYSDAIDGIWGAKTQAAADRFSAKWGHPSFTKKTREGLMAALISTERSLP
jgi:hypothetical protein